MQVACISYSMFRKVNSDGTIRTATMYDVTSLIAFTEYHCRWHCLSGPEL